MPEPRTCATMVRLEPTFQVLFDKVVFQSGMSSAGYLRRLIIEDLQRKELLSTQMLTRVTTMSPSEIDKLITSTSTSVA